MEILQLHRKEPYPPSSGMDTRVWKTAEKLDTLGTVSVGAPWRNDGPVAGIETIDLDTPWLRRKASRIYAWNGAFLLGADARWNPVDRRITSDVIEAVASNGIDPDLVVCECLQLGNAAARIARRHGAPLLVNQHNSEFEILEQFLDERPLPDRLGRRLVGNLREYEQRVIDRADAVVFQSPENVGDFDLSTVGFHEVIPNGTNVAEIRASDPDSVSVSEHGVDPSKPSCIFVGAFDYEPNRLAADAIADAIAPARPETEFLLVGRNSPTYETANVYATGFVDDLGAYLQYADVALCPLTMGSGTKLKMLDYLAAGLPIVTTPTGTQGLSIADGEHAVVVDSLDEFPDEIRRLLDSPERRSALASNAHRLADQYAWDALMRGYEDVVKTLVGERAPVEDAP